MKHKLVALRKKKGVLQVYYRCVRYTKAQKKERQTQTAWRKQLSSKSGLLVNGRLMISETEYTDDLLNCDLIILEDHNSERILGKEKSDHAQVQFFNIHNSPKAYRLFKLKEEGGDIEIHLNYQLFQIGEPKRGNFKLCHLAIDMPVEIRINGKLDHSMSARKERTYLEHYFIFHWLGEADQAALLREPFEGFTKEIPEPQKVIDLIKPLY